MQEAYVYGATDDFPMKLETENGLNPHQYPPVSVGFGLSAVLDHLKTEKAGHPVYRDVEFVKIAIPGDRSSLFFQPATDQHKKRFPQAYKDFKSRDASTPREGMPVEQWAVINKSTALNLKAINIHTVEDLAAVHDGHIEKLGAGGRGLREQAIAFLKQAIDSAAITKVASEKEDMRKQIQALQNQIAALQAGHVAPKGAQPAPTITPAGDPTDDVEATVIAAARRPRKGH